MQALETERLILRQISLDDAAFMRELLNEPAYLRFIGDRGVRTIEDARAYLLKGPVDSYERFGFGMYLVELKESGAPIGVSGLVKREGMADVEVGFAFLSNFWSQGFATESASAVLDYAREVLQLKRIAAITSPDNDGSIHVLRKLGLRFERLIRLSGEGGDLKLFIVRL